MTQEVLDCLRGGQTDNSVQQEEVVSDAAKDLRGSFPGEGAGRETAIPADREPEAAPGETPLPEPGRPERTVTREEARAAASAAIRTHWERLHGYFYLLFFYPSNKMNYLCISYYIHHQTYLKIH